MLIEFSVSNFLSFRDRQTLSMVAAPRLGKKENTFKPEVKGEKLPPLLKAAAIYGPNASGKSNLITALGFINEFISTKGEKFSAKVFRFDPALADQPSCFEWHFIANGQRYSYELAISQERVHKECLQVYPNGIETLLYRRAYENGHDQFEFGESLEGGELLHHAWKNLTAPKSLFLLKAIENSHEDLQQLRIPFSWFDRGLPLPLGALNHFSDGISSLGKRVPSFSEAMGKFLFAKDVPIVGIEYKENTQGNTNVQLVHQTALGRARFDLAEESTGTRHLAGFFLAWDLLQKSTFHSLWIDEFDSSLHPSIVTSLLQEHLQNQHQQQMIFTTHNTRIMNLKILRRDQFWLVERDENGASQLRSIHDFVGREGEDIEKRYFEGRYRALPILRDEH